MSRISYTDNEDFPGQFNLWRANVNRSLAGKKGQAALRDLEAALLAMPDKRLIERHLIDDKSDVCAVGALVVARLAKDGPVDTVKQGLIRSHTYCYEKNCGHTMSEHGDGGACEGCKRTADHSADYFRDYPKHKPDCQGFLTRDEAKVQAEAAGEDWYDDIDDDDEIGETEGEAVAVGVLQKVAWRLVELNDMDLEGVSPEARYESVLKWVQRQLSMTKDQMLHQDIWYG